ncbi:MULTISPECIES: hypothetical protein [Rhizobium]|uniref:Uncharacterized protein n=1 Tax=Rhizobium rhododendri TaxID=2506430 RepID=A0ABY8IHY7_9HYPH|nr:MULTISPECIES: hypothetical protein [Rhizobium]MBZ5762185.1 hypothetical protein [Rhizobium sp. VS19-DR96]MBZ5767650.1 hypothetical protein [Rhizobium sp. VS19-DR129.2]MBZ5775443.1 hypothetical protein [Rhizobium sp. VS19-DRK62.2]MBZ5786134.1 hypothetical protein [Rhizobium sp. VS19-DR121]MBZ5803746.1 hypothetical protein [Rhizobium sp. VS19-DR181]
MTFKAKDLSANQHFLTAILRCADELIAIYRENPRIASIFAAQQRWLLAHAGFALHYGYPDEPGSGLYAARYVDLVLKHQISSRNTAVAFLQEMLAYRFLAAVPDRADRRTRLLEPTPTAVDYLGRWLQTHLFILDSLDGGSRIEQMLANPDAIAVMQPMIARQIINSDAVRNPGPSFALFNWVNSGGVVMDYLISRIQTMEGDTDKILIGPISMRDIHQQFMISNAHLKRLLKQAAGMGSVGWAGAPGKSSFWLSRSFVAEYWNYQAEKFAVIDAAAQAALEDRQAPSRVIRS